MDDESQSWINAGQSIEFKVDQEKGLPFIGRPFKSKKKPDPDDSQRMFNNPNIKLTVKFKPKVKDNNYEFIVRIQPETDDEETSILK